MKTIRLSLITLALAGMLGACGNQTETESATYSDTSSMDGYMTEPADNTGGGISGSETGGDGSVSSPGATGTTGSTATGGSTSTGTSGSAPGGRTTTTDQQGGINPETHLNADSVNNRVNMGSSR